MGDSKQKTALVTGAAGFIGFHVSKHLLDLGWRVVGLDCLSDYYDVSLKVKRESMLLERPAYKSIHEKLETRNILARIFAEERPDIIIHLAAQAGVRYSIEQPRAYLESNIVGTFELLEAARIFPPKHMLLASTSSVYGANEDQPFKENMKADQQVSFYAATKKSTESMAHSYAHLFNLPITVFRFFTVYGPWGRPDMALFKFTRSILEGTPIDIYNDGKMSRDFTYIDDLVSGVSLLIDKIPVASLDANNEVSPIDSISRVAPFRLVNIGNSHPVPLELFIQAIEKSIGRAAIRNYLPMQPGDMEATWADTALIEELTGFQPKTDVFSGVENFVKWFKEEFNC